MTVTTNENLINEILNSPSAPVLVDRIKSILDKEKEKRTIFYNQITEQEKAEFINGEIIIHSPVKKAHNEISINLLKIIEAHVVENELGFVGFEKILIQCTRNDYEPDLCFFSKEVAKDFSEEQSLFPVPDFIVEVLSKGTADRDRGVKYEDYQNHGVSEYWIIDPNKKTVEQYLIDENGKYALELKTKSGEITTFAIKNLTIPINAIFDKKENHTFVRSIYQKK